MGISHEMVNCSEAVYSIPPPPPILMGRKNNNEKEDCGILKTQVCCSISFCELQPTLSDTSDDEVGFRPGKHMLQRIC